MKIPHRKDHSANKPFVRARKSLGQNFLVDRHAVERIINACAFTKDEVVLEIGPGTGILTREIAPRVKKLIAVEKDPRLCEQLNEEFKGTNVQIVHADFLEVSIPEILPGLEPVKVIGNLPYYITTPIINKVIESRKFFKDFFLTVQLEFAQRIVARPDCKEYGSFTCYINFYTKPTMFFNIKRTSFKPAPTVESCFLKLAILADPLYTVSDEEFLFKVIRSSFQQRRKTLINALSVLLSKDQLPAVFINASIDSQRRAESLGLEDFVRLAESLKGRLNLKDSI